MVTDISKLQQVAKTLLYCDINIDETFPFIAHHPIFSQTIYPIKIGDSISMLRVHICLNFKDESRNFFFIRHNTS